MRINFVKRKILYVLISISILIILAICLLHTPFIKSRILHFALNYLEQKQGIRLAVQSLDYNLFIFQFNLKKVVLRSHRKNNLPPFFQADEIKIRIPLALILRKKLHIRELEMKNPFFDIYIDKDGGSNIPILLDSETVPRAKTPIRELVFNRCLIKNARVHITDQMRRIEGELSALELKLNWLGEEKHSFLLEMHEKGSLSYKGMVYPFNNLMMMAEIDYKGIDLKEFSLCLGQNKIKLYGRLDDFNSPYFNGNLLGEMDLNEIRSFLAIDRNFSGKIHFHSLLQGHLNEINARVHLQSTNLHFEKLQNISLKADIDWKDKVLFIPSVQIAIAHGEARVEGEFHPLDMRAGNRINIRWESINLANFDFLFSQPSLFNSKTSGSIEAFWSNFSLDSVKGRANIKFYAEDQKSLSLERIPLSGHVLVKLDSSRIDVSARDFLISGASLIGNLNLGSDMLSGNFRLDARDLKNLTPYFLLYSKRLPKTDVENLDIDGQILISGSIGGTLKSPLIKADLEGKKISIHNMKDLKLEGRIIYESLSLRMDPLLIQENESELKIVGFYPLKPSGQSLHLEISGRELSLERILNTFNPGIQAEARLELKALIEGKFDEPIVKSSLILKDASFYGEKFDRLELSVNYQDEEVVLDRLEVVKAGVKLEANGRYNIKLKSYSAQLVIDSLKLQGLNLPWLSETVKTTIDFNLKGKGTLRSPHFMANGVLKELTYGPREIGDLQFQVNSSGEELKFQLMFPLYSSAMTGSLGINTPHLLNAVFNVNNLSLEVLKNRFLVQQNQEFSGQLTSQVNINVDINNPEESMNIQARVERLLLESGLHRLQNEGPIIITYDSTGLQIANLLLSGTGTSIRAKGMLPLKSPSHGGIELNADVDLSFISNFFDNIDAKGILKLDSKAIGTISNLELSADVNLIEAELTLTQHLVSFEGIKAHFKVVKNMAKIESVSFLWDNGQYELKGDIPLESLPVNLPEALRVFEKRLVKVSVIIKNFNPSVLKPIVPYEIFQQIVGKIDGRIEIEGERFQLIDLSAAATFDNLEVNLFGVAFLQENPTHILLNKGKVVFERFNLLGAENRLVIKGIADITGPKQLDIFIDGNLELTTLRSFMKEALFSGKSIFQFQITEDFDKPMIEGFIEIQDGGLQMTYPRLSLDQVKGRIRIDRNRIKVGQIQGYLNGGRLNINGDIDFNHWALGEAEIFLRAENSLFNFPKDLYSQVLSELKFKSDGKDHSLEGNITVVNAKYTEHFSIESAIFRYLRHGTSTEAFRKPNVFLSHLFLNVAIITQNAFLIENNIAKSEISANLKLTGTLSNPVLAGRTDLIQGGEIYFGQNTFLIEKGTIDFINPDRIEPDLNLNARTRVSAYDIQLLMTGTPDKLSVSFVSDPSLSEPNIISLLVTGRVLESASASVLNIAGNKALSYINNAVTGKIEKAVARSLGLESVRIDASLVSTEENPGTRITVGQHLIRNFELVFSQDLKDAQNRTWILNYNPLRYINLQGVKRDNNEYNYALRHELLFGLDKKRIQAPLSRLEAKEVKIEKIRLEGNLGFSEKQIRKRLKLTEGKHFNFYKLQESLDQIRELYRKNNYLSYRLNIKKEEKVERVQLIFNIESGPKILIKYRGVDIPKKLQKEIINIWIGSSFGPLVLEDIKHNLRLHLLKKRFYQVNVSSKEWVSKEEERHIVFQIAKGIKYGKAHMTYEGNRFISKEKLTAFLKRNNLIAIFFVNPQKVARSLEDFYAQNGFLRARVRSSKTYFEPEKRKVHINFYIEEGPQFKVGKIVVKGSQFFSENQMINIINISQGDVISLKKYNEANFKVREAYAQKGFNDLRVEPQIQVQEEKGLVDLIININENQQGKIAEIQFSGNAVTHKNVIQRELMFKLGDTVNFKLINKARKQLYDLGIFQQVNIEVIPIEQDKITSSEKEEGRSNFTRLYRIKIDVVELKPYRLRYGLQFDTGSSFGASGDLINRNFLGNAQLLGGSFRLNRDERDVRGFFRSPYFLSKKINTEFFTFINRSLKPSFTVDRIGFTFQQQVELSQSYILSYNYTFERHHIFNRSLRDELVFESTNNVGTLNIALTRDTRDDILNASRGMFLSQSVGYAPKLLGSDVKFVRYFGQIFAFKNLSNFLIYASGLRIGFVKELGHELVPSERFFAGGGTTIRGFERDEIGPKNPFNGLTEGGNAVFIINQELRFPIYKRLSGVVFTDLGNIYRRISDFDPFHVRKAAGFGLRFNTPFALIRFDWGFKLDRRPSESLSEVFFSIGQAF